MSMNVLTGRAGATASASRRPTARRVRGLLWLTLRQNRAVLWTLAVLVVLVAADLLWIHIASRHVVGVLRRTGCYYPETWSNGQCWTLLSPINRPTYWYVSILQPAVTALPLLIGVFIGAPLLAQEYERGTIRLIRAQSVSPRRWLASRLAVPGLAVLAATGVLAALMSWVWWVDIVHGPIAFDPPFQFFTYPALGVAPVAWSLFALALGVLIGQLVRRTLPAMFLTGALVAIMYGLVRWARPYFYPLVDQVVPLNEAHPTNSWLIDRGVVMADGSRVSTDVCLGTVRCDGATASWIQYHPAAHLVPIQLVEAALLLVLTAVALAVVFRRMRP
ncbi:ABC transporter permease [Kitasatospora aureofaciens]|uniref:ABC transporter permease n=1 Tax=Kitasatospora aureofaciens TaxID=1894 RepID=UPI001C478B78|nr:ABC transporter permease [Kitasatospora aureofaciens]MBV6699065.1 ABC transporter permease [Kitasatospora aureofaciens]